MSTFEHAGTTIEFLPSGKFRAVINGKPQLSSSLNGIKKKIDLAAKSEFKPFVALIEKRPWRDSELTEIGVTGVKAPRKGVRSYDDHYNFILANNDERQTVYENTAENIASYQAWLEHSAETKRIDQVRSEESQALLAKVKKLNANDYAPKKPANGSD